MVELIFLVDTEGL